MTGLRILALDLSLTGTGVCTHDRQTRTIRTKGLDGMARLAVIRADILAELPADLVVVEGYAMGRRDSHSHALGELGGIVRHALWSAGIPYIDVPPATLKKAATGRGNATKPEMLAEAIRRLGYQGHDDNQADALWLHTIATVHYQTATVVLPAAQRAVIERLPWPELDTIGGAP